MEALEYRDLDMYQVDSRLAQHGEVLVSLPERHAYACIAFIEMVRAVRSGSSNRVSLLVRGWRVLQGVLTILRVLIAHLVRGGVIEARSRHLIRGQFALPLANDRRKHAVQCVHHLLARQQA